MNLLTITADTLAVHQHEAVQPAVFAIALAVIALAASIITYRAVVALAKIGGDKNEPWYLLKSFPSTGGRILVELALAVVYVMGCMVADMIGRPVGETTQDTLGLFIAAMLGIGAGQFFGKRKTDENYVKAKAGAPGPTSTTINADSATVDVTNAPPAGGSPT